MGEATEEDVLDVVRLAVAEDEHPVSPTAEPPPPPPPPAPPNPEQAQYRSLQRRLSGGIRQRFRRAHGCMESTTSENS